jgi:hypothetical protein
MASSNPQAPVIVRQVAPVLTDETCEAVTLVER